LNVRVHDVGRSCLAVVAATGRLQLAVVDRGEESDDVLPVREPEFGAERDGLATEITLSRLPPGAAGDRGEEAARPQHLKPGADTQEALAAAGETCAAKLEELQKLHDTIRNVNGEIERLDKSLATLAKKRTETIDNPRREATGHAREIAAKIRELQPTAKPPTQPTEGETLAAHVIWVKDITKLALDLAQALRAPNRMTPRR
jgi:hypothetical protein